MSWEQEPLWTKARLFFERAFNEPRNAPTFGLWCSLGLELLARSALASISPTLLAEPDRNHKHLLHALNLDSELIPHKSIAAIQVFELCQKLFPDFTVDDCKAAMALINRRNEELHSGGAAFDEYPSSQWLAGFYRACNSLAAAMGESLTSLFGEDEASVASETLTENQKEVMQRVQIAIASHRTEFQAKPKKEQQVAAIKAEKLGLQLAMERHHRVECPACKCIATVQGRLFGKEHVSHEDDQIIVRQAVIPTNFTCSACELKLEGYTQLETAGLGDQYQRRTTYTPEEYYGLIDPNDLDSYLEEYLGRLPEYDNE